MSTKNICIIIAIIVVAAIGLTDTETIKDNVITDNNNPYKSSSNNSKQNISNLNNTFSDRLYRVNRQMRVIGRNFNSYNNDIDKREKQLAVFHCGVNVVNDSWINHTYSTAKYKNWRERDWKVELPYSTQEYIKKNKNTPYNEIK